MDNNLVNIPGVGASVLQACESIGAQCSVHSQLIPNTVTWQLVETNESVCTIFKIPFLNLSEVSFFFLCQSFCRCTCSPLKEIELYSYVAL